MQVKTYKDLIVWQKSMEVVIEVYKLVKQLPKQELYGLGNQMRRAAVSIPSNTAEGFHRNHRAEKTQFYAIAYASGAELETQIEICKRLGFVSAAATEKSEALLTEVMRMLNKLSSLTRS